MCFRRKKKRFQADEDCRVMREKLQDDFGTVERRIAPNDQRALDLRMTIGQLKRDFSEFSSSDVNLLPYMVMMMRYLDDIQSDIDRQCTVAAEVRIKPLRKAIAQYKEISRQKQMIGMDAMNQSRIDRIKREVWDKNPGLAPEDRSRQISALDLYTPEELYMVMIYGKQAELDEYKRELDRLSGYDELSMADRQRRDLLRSQKQTLTNKMKNFGDIMKKQAILAEMEKMNKEMRAMQGDKKYTPYTEDQIFEIMQEYAANIQTATTPVGASMGGTSMGGASMGGTPGGMSAPGDMGNTMGGAVSGSDYDIDELKDMQSDLKRLRERYMNIIREKVSELRKIGDELYGKIEVYETATAIEKKGLSMEVTNLKSRYNSLDMQIQNYKAQVNEIGDKLYVLDQAILQRKQAETREDFDESFDLHAIAREVAETINKHNKAMSDIRDAVTIVQMSEQDTSSISSRGGDFGVATGEQDFSKLKEQLEANGFGE